MEANDPTCPLVDPPLRESLERFVGEMDTIVKQQLLQVKLLTSPYPYACIFLADSYERIQFIKLEKLDQIVEAILAKLKLFFG